MLSYWETQSFLNYYYIIIGSGITGLSTAIELKEKFPDRSVLVLERGILPTGASTRNAGFACMGSATELLDDLESFTEKEVVKLYNWRKEGLIKLRNRLGDAVIGYAERGSYELISKAETGALEKLDYLNSILQSRSEKPVFRLANHKIEEFGFPKKKIEAIIENFGEGELNTGKMMHALIDLAIRKGVEIKTGANVKWYTEDANSIAVQVSEPFSKGEITFSSRKLILCTNAFTADLLPGEDVIPGRGQVLITAPVEGLKLTGVFHFDKGYYYFREINGRVLLGGGRNTDVETETNSLLELNETIQELLVEKLNEIILPETPFKIEQRWSGIMAFGSTKFPIIRQFSKNIYGAFRLGGMGVALGSKVAEEMATLIIESE